MGYDVHRVDSTLTISEIVQSSNSSSSHPSWIVYAGAGVLGKVAAKTMLDHRFIVKGLDAALMPLEWSARVGLAVLIVLIGLFVLRKPEPAATSEIKKKRASIEFIEERVKI
jgi:hypothetical protein